MTLLSNPLRVLVVEDEALIRLDAVETLQDAGFVVVEAENADEALRAFETDCLVDVVFTDVNMPGSMDGLEMAHRMAASRPATGIVIASGKMRPTSSELPERAFFINKPYDFDDVIKTIQSASSR